MMLPHAGSPRAAGLAKAQRRPIPSGWSSNSLRPMRRRRCTSRPSTIAARGNANCRSPKTARITRRFAVSRWPRKRCKPFPLRLRRRGFSPPGDFRISFPGPRELECSSRRDPVAATGRATARKRSFWRAARSWISLPGSTRPGTCLGKCQPGRGRCRCFRHRSTGDRPHPILPDEGGLGVRQAQSGSD